MFSLSYNPVLAAWQVRLMKFGFIWIPIKGVEFETYEQARNWIEQVGLDKHYDEQTYKGMHAQYAIGVR